MSDHRDSTTAPKSIGELTGNIVDNLRVARASAPDINDIQAEMARLIGLLDVIDDNVYDLPLANLSKDDFRKLGNVQHLAHIAVTFAKHIDTMIDANCRRAV